jgi:hypothetical protein
VTFILTPKYGEDLQINAWNWRPTVEFLRTEGVIDGATADRMTIHTCGETLDEETARRMGAALERKLATMAAGDRIRGDRSVTDEPKKLAQFDKPETIDSVEIYSASYDWLTQFKRFCERSGGFKIR